MKHFWWNEPCLATLSLSLPTFLSAHIIAPFLRLLTVKIYFTKARQLCKIPEEAKGYYHPFLPPADWAEHVDGCVKWNFIDLFEIFTQQGSNQNDELVRYLFKLKIKPVSAAAVVASRCLCSLWDWIYSKKESFHDKKKMRKIIVVEFDHEDAV